MIWVWFAHIVINAALVVWNLFVNFVLGDNLLAHMAPRLILALVAIFWFCRCWVTNRLPTEIFRWREQGPITTFVFPVTMPAKQQTQMSLDNPCPECFTRCR
jgi:hypothetical protein